ncbi:hypothetical protein RCL_jg19059.t1 [Rhizophagus clarus]|uniref:Uncharacterized protein n=1 Tax=Rhizophagus clarus TaxID=94130 RepID=A0A8H3QWK6_9GLOM|nr:hypothetical protein RCL_jg19059.t1 [Rhizophagus clarus]
MSIERSVTQPACAALHNHELMLKSGNFNSFSSKFNYGCRTWKIGILQLKIFYSQNKRQKSKQRGSSTVVRPRTIGHLKDSRIDTATQETVNVLEKVLWSRVRPVKKPKTEILYFIAASEFGYSNGSHLNTEINSKPENRHKYILIKDVLPCC